MADDDQNGSVSGRRPVTDSDATGHVDDRPPGARRGPGHSANLTREKIVEAAAAMDPVTLTVKAVAGKLGVDRKAVNYHVSGRDELLSLLGARALATRLEHLVLPGGDWRTAVRVFAAGMRDAMLRERSLALYVTHLAGGALLIPSERLASILLDAGFDDDTAGRALALVTAVANESVRARILSDQSGRHPSRTEVLRVLSDLPEGELPELRRILPNLEVADEARFDFDIDVVIAGLGSHLPGGPGSVT